MENKNKYKLGSEELNKELESKYYKFTLGKPQNIEVVENQEVEKIITEFKEKDNSIKLVTKYELKIQIDGEDKLWSVSKKVLTTITEFIEETNKFQIILREMNYDVIPLGLKSE